MDFYHPNNIYIIEDELLSGIENFMVKSYKQISDEIINKYEIKNWIMKNFTDDSARKLIILNGGGKNSQIFVGRRSVCSMTLLFHLRQEKEISFLFLRPNIRMRHRRRRLTL